jgi:HprK-related kinase A
VILAMHEFRVAIGPASFRVLSDWAEPLRVMERLYADYPRPEICDFTVRLEAPRPWRKWLRPSVRLDGDYMVADAAPLPLSHAVLGAEMAMNLQMALGWRRHVLLHASAVERDGRVLLMTGLSGSGKSTLAAMLGETKHWRFMGDEFALLDTQSGHILPFPRMVSLKNEAISVMESIAPAHRFGPLLRDTPKGDIRHLIPPAAAVEAMGVGGPPALLLYPRFGYAAEVRPMGREENFIRLTQASTNYVALGEDAFGALTRLVGEVPTLAFDFVDGADAMARIEALWAEVAA